MKGYLIVRDKVRLLMTPITISKILFFFFFPKCVADPQTFN